MHLAKKKIRQGMEFSNEREGRVGGHGTAGVFLVRRL
jgi:hypothetical protein